MRTLYESILDADFPDRDTNIDALAEFIVSLDKFKPKNEKEAYTYYWATRAAFYKILMDINDHHTRYGNKLRLRLLYQIISLPGKVDVPYWNPENEAWEFECPDNLWWDDLILSHEKDIDENNFRPWAANYSSGNLMHTFFDEEPDPETLPEELYKGFNHTKYLKIKKELLKLAENYLNKLPE